MEALRLVKVSFDNLENTTVAALNREELGIFTDDGGTPGYRSVASYLSKLPPERAYLGHDHQVYPKYVVERVIIRTDLGQR